MIDKRWTNVFLIKKNKIIKCIERKIKCRRILKYYVMNLYSRSLYLQWTFYKCESFNVMYLFSTVYCFGFQFYHIKLPHCITLFDNAINQKRRVLLHVSQKIVTSIWYIDNYLDISVWGWILSPEMAFIYVYNGSI